MPDVTKQDDESQTQYTLRIIRCAAWQEAHDLYCDYGEGDHPRYHPANPYADPSEDS